jgi:hypothetical protein
MCTTTHFSMEPITSELKLTRLFAHMPDEAVARLIDRPGMLRGVVDSITRAINVSNAQPNRRGYGEPDLHVGAPCSADPGPDPHR